MRECECSLKREVFSRFPPGLACFSLWLSRSNAPTPNLRSISRLIRALDGSVSRASVYQRGCPGCDNWQCVNHAYPWLDEKPSSWHINSLGALIDVTLKREPALILLALVS